MTDNDSIDRYGEPSEYGGYSGDNRRAPDGRLRPLSTSERARDMRREGIAGKDSYVRPGREH